MARQVNDGRGRIGGRAKGTPNKPKPTFREWSEELLSKCRNRIEREVNTYVVTDELLCAIMIAASIDRLTEQLAAMNGDTSTPEGDEPTTNDEQINES